MSLNDRVSSRSSSTSGEKRRLHRRGEGARGSGARTVRSPWPRRRAASVRRSIGREMRRARGRVAAATTSRMAVTASTGHKRRGPPNRRGVAPSSVPTMALVSGSRTGAAARHVGCESTTTVPARTVAACLSESGGSARPAAATTRPSRSRTTTSMSRSAWSWRSRSARAARSPKRSPAREATWRTSRSVASRTKVPRAPTANTRLPASPATTRTPRKCR